MGRHHGQRDREHRSVISSSRAAPAVSPPQLLAKAPAAKIPAIPPPPGIPPAGQKPTIAPQDKVTFTVGKLSSFMVKATGVPAPTLTQTGLPTDLGLSFDSKTGILQGSATKAIIAIITIQAKNKSGAVSKSFTLTVTDPPPCDGDTYTVRLRALQGADADGLAAALNGTFDEFSAVSATAPASSAGSNGTSWETVVSEAMLAAWPTAAPAWRHTSIVWLCMQ